MTMPAGFNPVEEVVKTEGNKSKKRLAFDYNRLEVMGTKNKHKTQESDKFFLAKKASILAKFMDNAFRPNERLTQIEEDILNEFKKLSPLKRNQEYNRIMQMVQTL